MAKTIDSAMERAGIDPSTLAVMNNLLDAEIRSAYAKETKGDVSALDALGDEVGTLHRQGRLEEYSLASSTGEGTQKGAPDQGNLIASFQEAIERTVEATQGTAYEQAGERMVGYIVKAAMVQSIEAEKGEQIIRHQLTTLGKEMDVVRSFDTMQSVDQKIEKAIDRLEESSERTKLLGSIYHASLATYEETTGKVWNRDTFGARKGEEPASQKLAHGIQPGNPTEPATSPVHTPVATSPTGNPTQGDPTSLPKIVDTLFHQLAEVSNWTTAEQDMKGVAWKITDNLNYAAQSTRDDPANSALKQDAFQAAKDGYSMHFSDAYTRGQDINANTKIAGLEQVLDLDKRNDKSEVPSWLTNTKDQPRVFVTVGKEATENKHTSMSITKELDRVKNTHPGMVVMHNNWTYGPDKIVAEWAKQTGTPQITAELPTRERDGTPIDTSSKQGKIRQQQLRNELILSAKPQGIIAYAPSYGGNKLIEAAKGVPVMRLEHQKSWSALEKTHANNVDQAIQRATNASGENGSDINKKYPGTREINERVQARAEISRENAMAGHDVFLKSTDELHKDQQRLDTPDKEQMQGVGILPKVLRHAETMVYDAQSKQELLQAAQRIDNKLNSIVERHDRRMTELDDYGKHLARTADDSDIHRDKTQRLEMSRDIEVDKAPAIAELEKSLHPRTTLSDKDKDWVSATLQTGQDNFASQMIRGANGRVSAALEGTTLENTQQHSSRYAHRGETGEQAGKFNNKDLDVYSKDAGNKFTTLNSLVAKANGVDLAQQAQATEATRHFGDKNLAAADMALGQGKQPQGYLVGFVGSNLNPQNKQDVTKAFHALDAVKQKHPHMRIAHRNDMRTGDAIARSWAIRSNTPQATPARNMQSTELAKAPLRGAVVFPSRNENDQAVMQALKQNSVKTIDGNSFADRAIERQSSSSTQQRETKGIER